MKNKHLHCYRAACRWLGWATLVVVCLQLLLFLVSWLIAATAPELMVRSLLSAEGIRWFVGHFMTNLQSPLLVWLLLMSIAGGAFDSALKAHRQSPSAYALHIVVIQLLTIVTLVLLLTIVPHALLLSVTGNLFPSSFSDGLIAILCFSVTLCSLTYCVASRHVTSVGDAYSVLCSGVRWFAVVIPLFVVSSQLYYSFMFVLR